MTHARMVNTAGKDRQIHSAVAIRIWNTLKYYSTGAVRTCSSSLLSTHAMYEAKRIEKRRSGLSQASPKIKVLQ